MRAVLVRDRFAAHQPDPEFIDQSVRFEGVTMAFVAEKPHCDLAQLGVHYAQQPATGICVAPAPSASQAVICCEGSGASSILCYDTRTAAFPLSLMKGVPMPEPDDRNTVTEAGSFTPERFARVRAIFEAALDRPASERRAYAAGACAGDDHLLREVEGMLAAERKADPLLDGAPPSSGPEEGRFPAGTVLAGRYRILACLARRYGRSVSRA